MRAFVLAFLVAGCATTSRLNDISVGMTQEQVITKMGNPTSMAAQEGIEVFRYYLYQPLGQGMLEEPRTDYFVKFSNGLVVGYGKMGDFDSTKDPTVNLNISNK